MESYKYTERFDIEGSSKDKIMDFLEKSRNENSGVINNYNVKIEKGNYEYSIKAYFLFYKLDAVMEIQDNLITIKYNTNIPNSYRTKAITELKKQINNIPKS
jgi:hypothetical protein